MQNCSTNSPKIFVLSNIMKLRNQRFPPDFKHSLATPFKKIIKKTYVFDSKLFDLSDNVLLVIRHLINQFLQNSLRIDSGTI